MRILHTSDWHLGRIFHGVHLTEDQSHVLDKFVALVSEAKPDVVLISGDIYDRSVPPTEAVYLLDETVSRILMDHKVPVIIIAGNHDSPERLGFGTRIMARQGLHVIGHVGKTLAPIPIADAHGDVYFCPLPYVEPPVVREKLGLSSACDHNLAMSSLISHMVSQVPQASRRVALAHAFVAGGQESESERPLSIGGACTVDSACFTPFHYVALGHLHSPQDAGGKHIRYAGSLMKYSFAEADHQKSVTLADIDGAGGVTLEQIALSPRREVRCLEGLLQDILSGPQNGESTEDYLMVTLKDSGAILDPMGKLREVYPNVLHIDRPHLTDCGELRGPTGDHRRISELDLFSSFFAQVTGEALSEEQAKVFADTAEALFRQEREVRV